MHNGDPNWTMDHTLLLAKVVQKYVDISGVSIDNLGEHPAFDDAYEEFCAERRRLNLASPAKGRESQKEFGKGLVFAEAIHARKMNPPLIFGPKHHTPFRSLPDTLPPDLAEILIGVAYITNGTPADKGLAYSEGFRRMHAAICWATGWDGTPNDLWRHMMNLRKRKSLPNLTKKTAASKD